MNKKQEVTLVMHDEQQSAHLLVHESLNGMESTNVFWSKEEGMEVIMLASFKRIIVCDEKITLIHLLKECSLPETKYEGFKAASKFHRK